MKLVGQSTTFFFVFLVAFFNNSLEVRGIECYQCAGKAETCGQGEVGELKPCVLSPRDPPNSPLPSTCVYLKDSGIVAKGCSKSAESCRIDANGDQECQCQSPGCNMDMCKCDANGKPTPGVPTTNPAGPSGNAGGSNPNPSGPSGNAGGSNPNPSGPSSGVSSLYPPFIRNMLNPIATPAIILLLNFW